MNPSTDEVFQNDFTPPAGKVLNFYKPNLKINKKSFEVKAEENFFTNLFKNIKPSNLRTKFIRTNELNTGVANPKSWYRKDDNLITLARLKNTAFHGGSRGSSSRAARLRPWRGRAGFEPGFRCPVLLLPRRPSSCSCP